MYEILYETEVNYIYNSELYTDKDLGEIDTGHEIDVFENEDFRIMLCPRIDLDYPLEIKIYKKNAPEFEICRLNFYKNEYINSNYKKSFKLSLEEQNMINEYIHTEADLNRSVYWANLQISILSNDYSCFRDVSISVDDFLYYDLYNTGD